MATETNRELLAAAGDEETVRGLAEEAMRENGQMPTLPQWTATNQSHSSPPPLREEVQLTPAVTLAIEHDRTGFASLRTWFGFMAREWLQANNIPARRLACLRYLLRETEAALPVLRAVLAREEAAT